MQAQFLSPECIRMTMTNPGASPVKPRHRQWNRGYKIRIAIHNASLDNTRKSEGKGNSVC